MRDRSKILFTVVILWISVFLIIVIPGFHKHEYLVEIQFCDNRPPIRVTVISQTPPSSCLIENHNNAVPAYKGYLNVCDVRTIEKLPKK